LNLKILIGFAIVIVAVGVLAVVYEGESASPVTFVNSEESVMSSELEMMETDGVKHLIPLDRIKGGGPPKDGIPSIDNPVFTDIPGSQFMSDSDTVIGL